MTILSVDNISYEVGNNLILCDISFSINEGDKLGIVGVNGSGKSTLVNIISGNYKQSSGNIFISKNKTIGLLKQNDVLNSDSSIYNEMIGVFSNLIYLENQLNDLQEKLIKDNNPAILSEYTTKYETFVKLGGLEYKNKTISILNKFGYKEQIFNQNISTLSGGEKMKLALIKLLIISPDLLILDEPTNNLDIDTLIWLESFLKSYKKTLVIISHDRLLLDSISNKILDIENRKAILYNGNYTAFVAQKQERKKFIEKQYNLQEKEIARIEGIIAQQRTFGQERNFITIKSKEKQIERLRKLDNPEKAPKKINFHFSSFSESGNDVLIVENLSKSFTDKSLFKDLSFTVKKKDRFFIIGKNGTGKSTLLKILCENMDYDSGDFNWGYNVNFGYYSQEINNLDDNKTLFDEISDEYPQMNNTEIRNVLAKFQFKADDVLKTCKVLSGGERARLTICKMILSEINVLILDEPTNHLDIDSCDVLENALSEYEGTIIVVSHDRFLINKLSTRILYLDNGNYHLFNDSYAEFQEYLLDKVEDKENIATNVKNTTNYVSENKNRYESNKKRLSDLRKMKTSISKLEKQIEDNENTISELYLQIQNQKDDFKKISVIGNKIKEIEDENETLYTEISNLETKLTELELETNNE